MKNALVDKKSSESKKKQRITKLSNYDFYHMRIMNRKIYQKEVTGGHPLENFSAQNVSSLSKMSKAEDLIKTCVLSLLYYKEEIEKR